MKEKEINKLIENGINPFGTPLDISLPHKCKVFVPLTERGFKIDVCSKCGNDYLDKNYCYECKDIQEIITIKVKKNSDVLECVNKFKDGNWCSLPGHMCIKCKNKIFRVYFETIINKELVEYCPDCWVKYCFGSVEELKE